MSDVLRFRRTVAKHLPVQPGVYALCDLDGVPIYVGKSIAGIRARVHRHITSARSDVIANRQIDVWEVAYVRCWPVSDRSKILELEANLFHLYHPTSPLMNGAIPAVPGSSVDFIEPEYITVQVLPTDEVISRRRVDLRLPRQSNHFTALLDHYLNVKDSSELLLALNAHFARLSRYFGVLSALGGSVEVE